VRFGLGFIIRAGCDHGEELFSLLFKVFFCFEAKSNYAN